MNHIAHGRRQRVCRGIRGLTEKANPAKVGDAKLRVYSAQSATTAGLPKEGVLMLSSEVVELIADFASISRRMDRETRAFWADAALRWRAWQDYHMPDDVLTVNDAIVSVIINPDGVGRP